MDPNALRQVMQGLRAGGGPPNPEMFGNMAMQLARGMGDERPDAELQEEVNVAFQNFGQMAQGIPELAPMLQAMQRGGPHVDPAAWIGQRVVLCDLANASMNGKVGTCESFSRRQSRFLVRVDGYDEAKAFQPKNIRLAVAVEYLPINEALKAALDSNVLADLKVAHQRAVSMESPQDEALTSEVMARLKVREEETATARAQLLPFKDKAPPVQVAAFRQQLGNTLGVAVQAFLPDTELKPFRQTLIACHSSLLEEAWDGDDAGALVAEMEAANLIIPLLGPLAAELHGTLAVASQRLAEVKEAEKRKQERKEKKLPDIPDPAEFICAITQSTMRDPVVAADGHTYEREAIEAHLKLSNNSPLTGQVLTSKDLTPNMALKQLIRSYQEKVQVHLVQLHESETLERTASREQHEQDKQALADQLKQLQEIDATQERRRALAEDVIVASMVRSCSNSPVGLQGLSRSKSFPSDSYKSSGYPAAAASTADEQLASAQAQIVDLELRLQLAQDHISDLKKQLAGLHENKTLGRT